MASLEVRRREQRDLPEIERFLADRHSRRVARLGRLEDTLAHPALIAERDGDLEGVLTYVVGDDACEVLTLHAADRHRGVGTALLRAAEEIARAAGCARMWLITTNDNLDALRFYQRRGFRLAALHRGAVDDSRSRFKPEIPHTGEYGIPLRDELELDKVLDS